MMKKLLRISLSLAIVAALILTLAVSASASSGSFIFDENEDLSYSEFSELESTARGICDSTGVSVCYLLTDDLHGKTAQTRAEEIANGSAATSNAIVLVDSYDTSDLVLDVYFFGITTMYQSNSETLLDAYRSDDTYAGATRNYLTKAQSILKGESAASNSNDSYQAVSDLGAVAGQLIVDGADLLSDNQEASLNSTAAQIGEKHNCSVVIVTTSSLDGKTAQQYADDYFDYHNYKKDGILLLVAFNNTTDPQLRAWAISTTGECIKTFSESKQEKVIEDIKSDMSSLNWNSAFETYLADLDRELSPHVAWYWIPLSLLIGFGIALIIAFIIKSQLKSVKMQAGAKDYVRPGSMVVTASRDTFLYHTITRSAKPKNTSSGGGTHIGSSGTSHGGSSGTF